MKKIFPAAVLAAVILSCNHVSDKGKFTVNGDLKSSPDQKIYLEEWFFVQSPAEVLDTGLIKNGKFTLSAIAAEEGLYHLRTENNNHSYLFINEGENMSFSADVNDPGQAGYSFSGASNSSLKKFIFYTDSIGKLITAKDRIVTALKNGGAAETDSIYVSLFNELKTLNENFSNYCFAFADTAKSPVLSLFAVTMAPVELRKLDDRLDGLSKRFPNHKGIAGALNYIKGLAKEQIQTKPQTPATVGNMAPEITMNDVNDKPFSLTQLRGKYVLVDFWASWCGPCRGENPNIVVAYNQFKDKNFTVLGVSLDDNKNAWINAIAEDKLAWPQISDLKKWNSASVGLYGFNGIPYNVLVDPQGKIIATSLRGEALQIRLGELLK